MKTFEKTYERLQKDRRIVITILAILIISGLLYAQESAFPWPEGRQTTRLHMLEALIQYAQNPANGIWGRSQHM